MGPQNPDTGPLIRPVYDKAPLTRQFCIFGLFFSALTGTSFIVVGALVKGSSSPLNISSNATKAVSLAINLLILVCTEPMGFIHSTSLKWALFREQTLEFNANLRLLTFSKTSAPNGVVANILYLFSLAMCYAASPLVFVSRDEAYEEHVSYSISKTGPICLGISLLIQCVICIWCLASSDIPTWNSSPIVTLAVSLERGALRSESRCMMSVHDRQLIGGPRKPSPVQGTLYQAHSSARLVLAGVSIVMAALLIWASLIIWNGYATSSGTSWSFLPHTSRTPSTDLYFFVDEKEEVLSEPRLFAALLFTLAIQTFLTVGTHCAELQVILSRDEAIWRSIGTVKGSAPRLSTFSSAVGTWQSAVLMCFKPLLHWIYGLAMFVDYTSGIYMFAPQITYLWSLWVLFMSFIWFVSCQSPTGYLPATYGHLKTMIDLVDEWHPRMFWGDKNTELNGVRQAGTAADKLLPIDPDALYGGGHYQSYI